MQIVPDIFTHYAFLMAAKRGAAVYELLCAEIFALSAALRVLLAALTGVIIISLYFNAAIEWFQSGTIKYDAVPEWVLFFNFHVLFQVNFSCRGLLFII